ncbi:MAG: hypothetical protein K6B14_06820 [Lachnospiraceae bacterium]|nr:hypothetical protein [Lachnospiraceae bacterium]
MSFFKKKNKKKEELDASFDRVLKEIQGIDEWDNPQKIVHYILDSCEQIIALTKQIQAQDAEINVLAHYMEDINTIRNLPKVKKDDLYIVAKNIEDLDRSRKSYEGQSPPLTDEQFMMIAEDEDRIPDVIKRMQDNELYQSKEAKTMHALEAQKSEYDIERDQIASSNRLIKRITILMSVTFMSFLLLFFILSQNVNLDISGYMLVLLFATAMGVFIIFLRGSHNRKRNLKLIRETNKTISALNVVRMKYANVTRAITYEQEKYGIATAAELNYLWDRYGQMVRAREQYAKDNDDYDYFMARLMRLLDKISLYDKKVWKNQVAAIAHVDVMDKLYHSLNIRRKKVMLRKDENLNAVKSERIEIDKMMKDHNYYTPEVMEIITSVDKICGISLADLK